ncbi:MAG: ribose 5-phosphate isomerase B [Sphingobacteriia bacterium]|nr:ribose 5-phosphate isomerase B [Sphingobacteriia bacterium]
MNSNIPLFLGSDHAGFPLKEYLCAQLKNAGYSFQDFGTFDLDSVDYPDFVHPVMEAIRNSPNGRGILICGSGQGVCMTANKYPFIRAALVWNPEIAKLSRQHNDANVLCLPGRFISTQDAWDSFLNFIQTPFEGGRHLNRIQKMNPK